MRSHLKVKVVSLGSEMTCIRRQEIKWKRKARYGRQKFKENLTKYAEKNFWSLRIHRTELKSEARTAHLAYGFTRNKSYACMEQICYGDFKGFGSTEPNWKAISDTVERFSKDEDSPQEIMQKFAEWLTNAQEWYEGNPERIKKLNEERPARIQRLKELSLARKEADVQREDKVALF